MLISQPVIRCLTNHSELCMSRLLNNQSRRISIYRLQRRSSFSFESSTLLISDDPVFETSGPQMACRTWLCYLQQIYPLWPLVEKKCQGNSSFTFLNLLLAYTTSSQTQEITRSFLGSGLTRNIIECSLALNVTAPLFSMR